MPCLHHTICKTRGIGHMLREFVVLLGAFFIVGCVAVGVLISLDESAYKNKKRDKNKSK